MRHVFAVEPAPGPRRFLLDNHKELEVLFSDVNSRTFEIHAPGCDILTAGFHCQPFAGQGQHLGLADSRCTSIWSIASYTRSRLPAIFVLENTSGLLKQHPKDFLTILQEFEGITDAAGLPAYDIKFRLLNSKDVGGVPQNRERVYIVGRKKTSIIAGLTWPSAMARKELREVLDNDGLMPSLMACLPPKVQTSTDGGVHFRNVLSAIVDFQSKLGRRISVKDLQDVVVNDGGSKSHYNVGYAPCLTASRGRLGFWLPAQGRRLRPSEMARLQGINRTIVANVPKSVLGHMYGNAFTLPVIREVLRAAMTSTGFL